ncbi:hypothetical protein J7M28_12785 [bacterium]|nr:hypothetical protein [bacterium]
MDRSRNTEAVYRSAEELRRHIAAHCRLLASQHGKGGEREAQTELNRPRTCDSPNSEKLRAVILEAISVLDGTRRCFKSRQLEDLRKKLTKALL